LHSIRKNVTIQPFRTKGVKVDLSKSFNVQADYKDRRMSPSWDLFVFADLVFIDKTSPSAASVYQLNDSSLLSDLNFHYASSWKDSCTHLGELEEVDKKKKIVRLANNQSVNYKHLNIINGKKPLISTINHEITNALQALMEALKVNPNVDTLLLPSWTLGKMPENSPTASESGAPNTSQNVVKATHPYFADSKDVRPPFQLDAINERLYEIYI